MDTVFSEGIDNRQSRRDFAMRLCVCLACALLIVVVGASGFLGDSEVADAAVLKQGSRGSDVKSMQQKLIRWGYLKGSADGVFGAEEERAYCRRSGGQSHGAGYGTENINGRNECVIVNVHRP